MLGRLEEALPLRRDVYSGWLKLLGEEHENTFLSANNFAASLLELKRFEEAKALMRKTVPVARRVLGEDHHLTLSLRWIYANTLSRSPSMSASEGATCTVADLSEAVMTLESVAVSYKRVMGISHPETSKVQIALNRTRTMLARARE